MYKMVVLLVLGSMLGACAKKSSSSDSSSESVIGSCYFIMGGNYGCMSFDANIPQVDRASACSGATTSAASTCPSSYKNHDSYGQCVFTDSGFTLTYRFYVDMSAAEQVMCGSMDDNGGTATWQAD
ncbi:MAG: hypothetical protein KF799_13345 [Bdellovibrionales bacterium]|nr:hypothetical protein [Bdellovibrionales bacterium]